MPKAGALTRVKRKWRVPNNGNLRGAALRGRQAATLKNDDPIPRWPSTQLIHVVVVGGQTNSYDQVANMSYVRSVSIDKWT
jgi:hypothetical protein